MTTLSPTWNERERKILAAVVASENDDTDAHTAARNAIELDDALFCRTIERLHEGGYIDAAISKDGADRFVGVHVRGSLPPALQEVGLWPSKDPYETLIGMLQEQIDSEKDDDRRSKLVRFRNGLAGAGNDVAVSILTAYIERQVGV